MAWMLVWTVIMLIFISQNVVGDISAERPVRWFNSILQEVLYWLPFVATNTTGMPSVIIAIGPCFISAAGMPSAWM